VGAGKGKTQGGQEMIEEGIVKVYLQFPQSVFECMREIARREGISVEEIIHGLILKGMIRDVETRNESLESVMEKFREGKK
jgi:hypothetical protein